MLHSVAHCHPLNFHQWALSARARAYKVLQDEIPAGAWKVHDSYYSASLS